MSTIGIWFEKKSNTLIWLPIVKSLSLQSVLKSIPIFPISNNLFQCYEENITMSKTIIFGFKKYDTNILLQTKIYVKLDFSSSLYMPHAMETQRSNSSSGH